jgi:hypothetical protein
MTYFGWSFSKKIIKEYIATSYWIKFDFFNFPMEDYYDNMGIF